MKTFLLLIIGSLIMSFSGISLFAQEEMMEEEPEVKKTEQKKEDPKKQEMPEGMGEDEFKDVPDKIPDAEKYFRESFEDSYDLPFEEVWNAVKAFMVEDLKCMVTKDSYAQTEEGLYKGSLVSDMCVLAEGKDSTNQVMKRYSKKSSMPKGMPYIRGGIWTNVRMQFKFIIRELEDGKVTVKLKGEMSGFEEHVTTQVHFWDSNGYLETIAMRKVRQRLGLDPNAF